MKNIEPIQQLLEPSLNQRGYELIQVKWQQGRLAVLQIMVEHQNLEPLTMKDCVSLTRLISTILDVSDPISHAYSLEVGSPGIDRPLVKKQDFQRFVDQDVWLETEELGQKPKRWQGKILGVKGDDILLQVENEEQPLALPYQFIRQAHLQIEKKLLGKPPKPGLKNNPKTKQPSKLNN